MKYTVQEPFGTKTLKVTPTANGPVSKLQVNGKDVASGKESEDEPVPGDYKVEVTAQDGKTVETYEITSTVAPPSTDATLKALTPSGGKLVPDFDPKATAFTCIGAAKDDKKFTLTPEANGPGATIQVNGKACENNKPSEDIELKDTGTSNTLCIAEKCCAVMRVGWALQRRRSRWRSLHRMARRRRR